MRHRILRRLLICCLLLPASACADKGSGEENGGNGGNADDGKRPYSEMMYVKRQGDNLYISAKMDASTDILYWFKRCLFNEVYTFYRVGTLPNTDRTPTTRPESEPAEVLNLAYSDNIGPFNIQGGGWCGANHKYMERTARTAYNKSFSVTVDGQPLEGDKAVWSRQGITIEAENVILDPTHPYKNADNEEELRDELCHEFATYRIFRNNIDVTVRHDFCCKNPVTIAIYYGLECWTNTETFDRDMPIKFLPIKWEKLRLKLRMAEEAGIDQAITFEFSHFMSPQSAYLQAGHLYDRYLEYLNTSKK